MAQAGCHHCGETLPARAVDAAVGGEMHTFCCTGCAAAAQWIL
ncbi:MAG TPA: heavy metal translocating P-type ATPase metal-binding domain-containing protein, partial [Lysobacter sp.]